MRGYLNKSNIIKFSVNTIMGIFTAISIISISTIMALNMKFIYKIIIENYNLVSVTGISSNDLFLNYSKIINYLQNPFDSKLVLPNFVMSEYGKIHFKEVKDIFIVLIIISIIFLLFITGYIVFSKIENKKEFKINIINNLNLGANILICFFGFIIAAILIDFSKAFTLFHKIIFNNDYWIFDPSTDPIINALPEELFIIYALIILVIILSISVIIKINKRKIVRGSAFSYSEKMIIK